ncbi:hypothetical protein B0A53_06406 [Rhodotorula sp. CCFEE 5036]|nr:hypothetical protein B0A53_06406 [Rhodotorula sp. CCFEE 5036]
MSAQESGVKDKQVADAEKRVVDLQQQRTEDVVDGVEQLQLNQQRKEAPEVSKGNLAGSEAKTDQALDKPEITAELVVDELVNSLSNLGPDPVEVAKKLLQRLGAAASTSAAKAKSTRMDAKSAKGHDESNTSSSSSSESEGGGSPLAYKTVSYRKHSKKREPERTLPQERSRSNSPVLGTIPRTREDKQQRKKDKKQAKVAAKVAAASSGAETEVSNAPETSVGKRKTSRKVDSKVSYASVVSGAESEPSKTVIKVKKDNNPSDSSSSDSSSDRESSRFDSSDESSSGVPPSDSSSSSESSDESDVSSLDGFRVVTGEKRKYPKAGSKLKVPKVHFRAPFRTEIPEKYSGKDRRPQTLERWHLNIRSQLRAAMIHEDSQYATTVVMTALSDAALTWAGREIQRDLNKYLTSSPKDLRRVASPWPLDKIRNELHAQFVDPDNHHQADAEWRTLSQRRNDGTYMPVKFVNALQPEITKELHRTRHLRGWDQNPKIRLRHLVREAMNIEQALNLMEESTRQNSASKATNYEMLQSRKKSQN